MYEARAYAAENPKSPLKPFGIQRRDPLPNDVQIEILYCGVCHSDLHTVRNEWNGTLYPVVPGHEIIGRVVKAGNKVTRFREGDLAAVGCMVGSCGKCNNCRAGLENYCEVAMILTYNSEDPRDSGRRDTVFTAYRAGQTTSAQRTDDERAAISNAVH